MVLVQSVMLVMRYSNVVAITNTNQYRARAAEVLAQSKVEQDPEVAAMLEMVAA